MTHDAQPMAEATGRELTGRKVFAIIATGFAIIIGVNVFMAYSAISSFPGLVVKNSYVASQSFDAERTAQEALGLNLSARHIGGVLEIGVRSDVARIAEVAATIGRPTHARDDMALVLDPQGSGTYLAEADLGSGVWILRLSGSAEDGTAFRKDLTLVVR